MIVQRHSPGIWTFFQSTQDFGATEGTHWSWEVGRWPCFPAPSCRVRTQVTHCWQVESAMSSGTLGQERSSQSMEVSLAVLVLGYLSWKRKFTLHFLPALNPVVNTKHYHILPPAPFLSAETAHRHDGTLSWCLMVIVTWIYFYRVLEFSDSRERFVGLLL